MMMVGSGSTEDAGVVTGLSLGVGLSGEFPSLLLHPATTNIDANISTMIIYLGDLLNIIIQQLTF